MASTIVVNPNKPSQVVVSGSQTSGTPINITSGIDYARVKEMINEEVSNIDLSAIEKEIKTLTDEVKKVKQLACAAL